MKQSKKLRVLVIGKNGRLGKLIIKRMQACHQAAEFEVTGIGRSDSTWRTGNQDVIVVAVKPDQLEDLAQKMSETIRRDQVLISMVSGKRGNELNELFATESIVYGTTSVGIELGIATVVCRKPFGLSAAQKQMANKVLDNWGTVEWVNSGDEVIRDIIDVGCMLGILAADARANVEARVANGRERELATRRVIHAMDVLVRLCRSGHSLESVIAGVAAPGNLTDSVLAKTGPTIVAAKTEAFKLAYERILALGVS